jgi:hypothetical protein
MFLVKYVFYFKIMLLLIWLSFNLCLLLFNCRSNYGIRAHILLLLSFLKEQLALALPDRISDSLRTSVLVVAMHLIHHALLIRLIAIIKTEHGLVLQISKPKLFFNQLIIRILSICKSIIVGRSCLLWRFFLFIFLFLINFTIKDSLADTTCLQV